MNKESIKTRIKNVRSAMKQEYLDALLITSPANVTYLSAFTGDDSWALLTARHLYLLTDSRYTALAQKECSHCKIVQRNGPVTQAVRKILSRSKSVKIVGIENSTSIATFDKLKKLLKSKIKKTDNIIESIRKYKDPEEISSVRTAAEIARTALQNILNNALPGITENQLGALLDLQIRWLNSHPSFETIVAFGSNASRPHHRPGPAKLKKNDTILIDFGATHKSYHSDLTRCFAIGKPGRFYAKVYRAVWEAQQAAINAIQPGIDVSAVDRAARDVLKGHNLPLYGHGTGHGLGLEIHEAPFVSSAAKGTLEPGQIITIEPGIYLPGKFGIRLEDDILITKSGAKILSPPAPASLPILEQ